MPLAFSPGSYTNRDRWASTSPLRAAQAGGPLVPVGDINWDRKASEVFFESGWFRGFGG